MADKLSFFMAHHKYHVCRYCGEKFRYKAVYDAHLKKVHKEDIAMEKKYEQTE
jgi:hypothetical protein